MATDDARRLSTLNSFVAYSWIWDRNSNTDPSSDGIAILTWDVLPWSTSLVIDQFVV